MQRRMPSADTASSIARMIEETLWFDMESNWGARWLVANSGFHNWVHVDQTFLLGPWAMVYAVEVTDTIKGGFRRV